MTEKCQPLLPNVTKPCREMSNANSRVIRAEGGYLT